jgi:hypothetical protein
MNIGPPILNSANVITKQASSLPDIQNPQHLKAHQATDLTVATHATHVTLQPHPAYRLAQSRPVSPSLT